MNEPIIWPPKYIDPTTDFGFKRIFKDEEITRGFLNDLVQSHNPEVHIASVKITDGEADEANKDIRRVVYDVNCITDTGEEFIIEMQNDPQDFFSDRIVLYLARAASRQQSKGYMKFVDENGELQKEPWKYNMKNIYGVFFMNFIDKEHPQNLSHFQFMETKEHYKDSDALQYWKIQMPLYRKMKESDCETVIDKWIYNLSNMPKMKTQLSFKQDRPLFMRLEKLASYSDMTREQQWAYDSSYHNYVSYYGQLATKLREGKEIGFIEGETKGREEGLAEGREQGRTEQLVESIKKFISKGFDFDEVVKILEVPADQIPELRRLIFDNK
jgi:predicted transposase/invertase (TIGR01784 family)